MSLITIKCVKGGKQVRLNVPSQPTPSYNDLALRLRQAHGLQPLQPIRLGWIDEDGDKIVLSNDGDVAEYWTENAVPACDSVPLRLFIALTGRLLETEHANTPPQVVANSETMSVSYTGTLSDDDWHAVKSFADEQASADSDGETLSDLVDVQDDANTSSEANESTPRSASNLHAVADGIRIATESVGYEDSDLDQRNGASADSTDIPLPPSSQLSNEIPQGTQDSDLPTYDDVIDHPDIDNLRSAYEQFLHTLTGQTETPEDPTLTSSLFNLVNSATTAASQAYGLADLAANVVRNHAGPFSRQAGQELGSVARIALAQFLRSRQQRLQERLSRMVPAYPSPTASTTSVFDTADTASRATTSPARPVGTPLPARYRVPLTQPNVDLDAPLADSTQQSFSTAQAGVMPESMPEVNNGNPRFDDLPELPLPRSTACSRREARRRARHGFPADLNSAAPTATVAATRRYRHAHCFLHPQPQSLLAQLQDWH